MTGTDTGFHDKSNGAFFPLVHGMELRRVQQRFLASLLRQPGLVPTVLTTGIGPEDFPEEWRHAFIISTKEPGRAQQIVAEHNGDPTIRHLYTHQIVLLGHGQARQMAEQIIASNRRREAARRAGDHRPSGTGNLQTVTQSLSNNRVMLEPTPSMRPTDTVEFAATTMGKASTLEVTPITTLGIRATRRTAPANEQRKASGRKMPSQRHRTSRYRIT